MRHVELRQLLGSVVLLVAQYQVFCSNNMYPCVVSLKRQIGFVETCVDCDGQEMGTRITVMLGKISPTVLATRFGSGRDGCC